MTRMRNDIPAALESRGFTIKQRDPFSFYLGCVQLVLFEQNTFIGVADPRRADDLIRGYLPFFALPFFATFAHYGLTLVCACSVVTQSAAS